MIKTMIKSYIANLNDKEYIELQNTIKREVKSYVANLNDKEYIDLKSWVMQVIQTEDQRRGIR
jgi:predicted adenine nucleotide alpha hydrolase (AANH) superfamily ATPase